MWNARGDLTDLGSVDQRFLTSSFCCDLSLLPMSPGQNISAFNPPPLNVAKSDSHPQKNAKAGNVLKSCECPLP